MNKDLTKITLKQNRWQQLLLEEQEKPYFKALADKIARQREEAVVIYPAEHDTFSALNYVDLADVKVVIIGQDPYHGANNEGVPQAHGLAFSVQANIKIPPSLVNIYKELNEDVAGFIIPQHGSLTSWAEQGVLLLNTVLTVEAGKAHSHAKWGWEIFTDKVIAALNEENTGCVFVLWGSHAHKKGKHIDTKKHKVIKSVHPSPLSVYRGFYGSKPFSQANDWLTKHNKKAVNWLIDT